MKINPPEVEKSLDNARRLIEQEQGLSASLRTALEVLLLLVTVLLNRTTLNSKNSSKPTFSYPDRLKTTRKKSDKSSGAQAGHLGKTLEKTDEPDVIEVISIDRRTLPKVNYHQAGFETRQVFGAGQEHHTLQPVLENVKAQYCSGLIAPEEWR